MPATKTKRAAQTAQATAPWVALVTALAIPFFSYLETRDATRAARARADAAQKTANETKVDTSAATTKVTTVDEDTDTAFKLVVFELKRLAKDVDACHQRYNDLEKTIEDLRARRPAARTTPEVRRPPPQMTLPADYRDAKKPPAPVE